MTQPSEVALRWQFEYEGSHRMTELTDGRSHKTKYSYKEGQLIETVDPLERKTKYEYKPFETTTTMPTAAVTRERFTSAGLATSVTKGYGTALETIETRTHDRSGNLTKVTDGNLHTTKYTYDSSDNKLSMVDAAEHETKWTYD